MQQFWFFTSHFSLESTATQLTQEIFSFGVFDTLAALQGSKTAMHDAFRQSIAEMHKSVTHIENNFKDPLTLLNTLIKHCTPNASSSILRSSDHLESQPFKISVWYMVTTSRVQPYVKQSLDTKLTCLWDGCEHMQCRYSECPSKVVIIFSLS